mgnify:CR=1 FL=1
MSVIVLFVAGRTRADSTPSPSPRRSFVTGCTLVCFNMLPSFYNEYFGCSLLEAGLAAAPFGCAAAAARLLGRWASEAAARRFGMRGRLWLMWLLQVGGHEWRSGFHARRSTRAPVPRKQQQHQWQGCLLARAATSVNLTKLD